MLRHAHTALPAVKGADDATKDEELASAQCCLDKAQRTLDSGLVVSRVVKYTAASVLSERAAQVYLRRARWRQASDAFVMAADAELQLGDRGAQAAAAFLEAAGDALSKVDPYASVSHYRRAINILSAPPISRSASAAGVAVKAAELLERNGAQEEAAAAYGVAAEHYLSSGRATLHLAPGARCLYEAGQLYATCGDFEKAHRFFDRAALFARDDNLLKNRSPDLLLDAGLAILAAGDLPAVQAYCEQGATEDAAFAVGRERRFLLDVADCATHWDNDTFMDHVWNFDYVRALRPFELALLKHVCEIIKAGPQDADDDEGDGAGGVSSSAGAAVPKRRRRKSVPRGSRDSGGSQAEGASSILSGSAQGSAAGFGRGSQSSYAAGGGSLLSFQGDA